MPRRLFEPSAPAVCYLYRALRTFARVRALLLIGRACASRDALDHPSPRPSVIPLAGAFAIIVELWPRHNEVKRRCCNFA